MSRVLIGAVAVVASLAATNAQASCRDTAVECSLVRREAGSEITCQAPVESGYPPIVFVQEPAGQRFVGHRLEWQGGCRFATRLRASPADGARYYVAMTMTPGGEIVS